MATSTSITQGAAYSWAASDFAWSDAQMGERPILALATYTYKSATDETLTFSEREGNKITKPFAESFGSGSGYAMQPAIQQGESFTVGDGYGNKIIKPFAEAFETDENCALSTTLSFDEAFALFDTAWRTTTLAQGEGFTLGDGYNLAGNLSISELVGILDAYALGSVHGEGESFSVAESYVKKPAIGVWESFETDDAIEPITQFNLEFDEMFEIDEAGFRNIVVAVSEACAFADAITKAVIFSQVEEFSATSTYTDSIGFILKFIENLAFAEKPGKMVELPQTEAFGATDSSFRQPVILANESLNLSDDLIRNANFNLSFTESVTLDEICAKTPKLSIKEFLKVIEVNPSKQHIIAIAESLSTLDDMARVATFNIALAEGLSIADAAKRSASLTINQTIQIADALQRAGDMIVSDMVLSSEATDLAGFKDLMNYGNVPGYERWRDFIPGDYKYQEAMFRAVLESVNSDRAMLSGFQVSVDVPDLIDRGSATVTTAADGVRITFARKFHIVPEITMAIRGGTGTPAIPAVTSVDTEGFNAVLQVPGTGALTTGTFTWAAHGY